MLNANAIRYVPTKLVSYVLAACFTVLMLGCGASSAGNVPSPTPLTFPPTVTPVTFPPKPTPQPTSTPQPTPTPAFTATPQPTATPIPRACFTQRCVRFAGIDWAIKSSEGRVGPGPNFFSEHRDDVFVDEEDGSIHLKITQRDERWYAAEIVSVRPVGYGKYTFALGPFEAEPDQQVRIGFFTWDDSPECNHREIDIEFAKRSPAENSQNGAFTVQPWQNPDNSEYFYFPLTEGDSEHAFQWAADLVIFTSRQADGPLGKSWTYEGPDICTNSGNVNVRINLWLAGGNPPDDGREVEMVITDFKYEPSR